MRKQVQEVEEVYIECLKEVLKTLERYKEKLKDYFGYKQLYNTIYYSIKSYEIARECNL